MIRKFTILTGIILLIGFDLVAQPFFPVRVDKRWGAIDSTGKIVLEPQYTNMYAHGKHNEFIVAETADSTFLINSRLQIVARTTYAAIIEHGEGLFQTRLRSSRYFPCFYGLMDSVGHVIVEPKFTLIHRFTEGVTKAEIYLDTNGNFPKSNIRAGIIDKRGNWVIEPTYYTANLKTPSDGLINFYEPEKGWGAMDATAKIVIEPKYYWLGPCKYGYMEYRLSDHSSGLMKRDETPTVPDKEHQKISYHPLSPTDTLVIVHNTVAVKNGALPFQIADGRVFTVSGQFLYKAQYGEECSQECNGFFQISDEDLKRGMMNASGEIVTKPSYEVLQWDQIGLKQVKKNNLWGYINDDGKEVISCIYTDSKSFKNGLAAVYIGGQGHEYIFPERYPNVKMGYINQKGEMIWQPSW